MPDNTNIFSQTPIAAPPGVLVAEQIFSECRRITTELISLQKNGIALLWKNPRATPQQVCDGLGANAAKIFQAHAALTQMIVALAQLEGVVPDIDLPTHEFVVNPNGTVTVGNPL